MPSPSIAEPHQPPDRARPGAEVYFRQDEYRSNCHVREHTHAWGQLNYGATGVMEINAGGKRYLSSPQYAIWVPPHQNHDAVVRQKMVFYSAYIDASLCTDLPAQACVMVLDPLLKAILANFARRGIAVPSSEADLRLAQVVVDQIKVARHGQSYLPDSDDPVLATLLGELMRDPGNNCSLAEWAQRLHVTERTLARRCLRDLNMSFSEWRQRQRFLAALTLLEQGRSVQSVALDMGYSTSSAFIAMFRRQSGSTPDQFRKGLKDFADRA